MLHFAAKQIVFRTNSAKENTGRKSKFKALEMSDKTSIRFLVIEQGDWQVH